MTISNETGVFQVYSKRGERTSKSRMKRQNCFDNYDDLPIGLSDANVSLNYFTKTLSSNENEGPKSKRSSLIFDWLSNPDNQFMFQDRNIDSHVFRSNSAVQARPSGGFIKNSLYYSMREEISKITDNVLDSNVDDFRSEAHGMKKETLFTKESMQSELDDCNNLRKTHEDLSCSSTCLSTTTITSSDETTTIDKRNDIEADDDVFCSEEKIDNDIEDQFDNMSLLDRDSVFYGDDKARSTSYSLPNFTKTKRKGKLRRINSDALFYKDTYRDSDKQRKTSLYKKRKSLTLKNLLDEEDKDISRKRFSFLKLNTQKLLSKLEEIISKGDVSQVRELAECGFDFNAKDSAGNCALHYAALRGDEAIINEILDNGGSVWIRNGRNQLPVELASNMNVRMLLSRVTLFYREQYAGQTESHLTCKGMSFEL